MAFKSTCTFLCISILTMLYICDFKKKRGIPINTYKKCLHFLFVGSKIFSVTLAIAFKKRDLCQTKSVLLVTWNVSEKELISTDGRYAALFVIVANHIKTKRSLGGGRGHIAVFRVLRRFH